ncbi:acyl carrier protein [Streptococcus anginosus]|uniref:acyl carrier protein n=1 Tax=Streptococcus anginosus TaxID=1328 RepID=UPI00066CC1C5|nr:acyl carrier protein [Streptococcus anginosus]
MTEQKIYEKIVEIIQESRGKEFQVSQTLSLKDDLQADSVDLMEFILTVEDEFGIEISDEDIDELKNVSDVVACVQKNLNRA